MTPSEDEDDGRVQGSSRSQKRRQQDDDTSVYDPNQGLDERRKVRRGYRELKKTVIESRPAYLKPSSDGVQITVNRVNELYKGVRQAAEAVLDSELLTITSELAYQQARNVKLGAAPQFDLDDYVLQIKRFLTIGRHPNGETTNESDDEDNENDDDLEAWKRVGGLAGAVLLRPTMNKLFMDLVDPKAPRQQTQRNSGNTLTRNRADLVEPEVLSKDDIAESNNGTSTVVMTVKAIMEVCGEPVNLFELILNPESFSQSVENLFYVSFLVREGLVTIDKDAQGIPLASLVKQPDPDSASFHQEVAAQRQLVAKGQRQAIFELDIQSWRDLIDAFEIQESIIPSRDDGVSEGTGSGRWYG
ncbi:Nse4 C-terminal-domain-containing protein [Lipomyces arxii]|uniref:Nse4 C-terminal-domain-containing protein n=1 Tax=Lipomyces arxii TaxID=56418 RepID=UPI0034CE4CFA